MAKGKLNRHISDWVLIEYEIDGEKIEDKDFNQPLRPMSSVFGSEGGK